MVGNTNSMNINGRSAGSGTSDLIDDLFGDEGSNGASLSYETSSTTKSNQDEIEAQSKDIEQTTKRTELVALLVLLTGAAASASFLWLGITNEMNNQNTMFWGRATDMAAAIDGSWQDYTTAVLWIHESCGLWRNSSYDRDNFRNLYEYLVSSGLDFYAAEWVPNISQAERKGFEDEAREYFLNDTRVNYTTGFRGLEPDPNSTVPGALSMQVRSEQPFYMPVHFVEPIEHLGYSTHLDLYSLPYEIPIMRKALDDVVPVLTSRLYLAEKQEKSNGYAVVLFHPGKPLTSPNQVPPRDLAALVIYVNELLARGARAQGASLGAYLYDSTISSQDAEITPEFIGGIKIEVNKESINGTLNRTVSQYNDLELHDLQQQHNPDLFYQQDVKVGERVLTLVVVPVDDGYEPAFTLIIVTGIFIFLAALLLSLWMIHNMRRSIKMHRILTEAAAEAAIVSNLFPANVRGRMIQDAKNHANRAGVTGKDVFLKDGSGEHRLSKRRLNSMLTSEGIFGSKPIAELHPYTTIMFADLVGFTAWSSVREPYQVFTLLEILYHSYDNICKRRRVFKVETIGDCYVAVCGLPEPRKDHAVVMARFATDCMYRMHMLVKALEVNLGPDTSELGLRIGLHSGQVTAGVLRGDKGRFQLFGDTMNTASRMESTGVPNKIHISQETADLLKAARKEAWLLPRKDLISAKGKGLLQTYFLKIISGSGQGGQSANSSQFLIPQDLGNMAFTDDSKTERLIDWNVEVLSSLIRRIVARRAAASVVAINYTPPLDKSRIPLDEVVTIITLPECDPTVLSKQVDPDCILLDQGVIDQLKTLVTQIAGLYHPNPFHNFEHASHVTMSVVKMLSRIVDPREIAAKRNKGEYKDASSLEVDLHDHTYGITSDPLSLFACTFSALIHDLDHSGVTNMVLLKEGSPLADKYKKSFAEQNSIDLAFDMLTDKQYAKLLQTVCCNENDFRRFRQLVVNSVCATDIMDKELGAARKDRWEMAFSETVREEPKEVTVNRKATIVIEHLIQASDISHTMQHWHIYTKWNERLFRESYQAYKQGRLDHDPSISWHMGEIGFFDFYIIPLAKKLFKCGVFGVQSDEFLNYAEINRKEWEKKGAQMVEMYLTRYERDFGGNLPRRGSSETFASIGSFE